jgi:hypothetical protein
VLEPVLGTTEEPGRHTPHGAQAKALRVSEKAPEAQPLHCRSVVDVPAPSPNVPAAQSVHGLQELALKSVEKVPAPQGEHSRTVEASPGEVTAVPGGQIGCGTHSVSGS